MTPAVFLDRDNTIIYTDGDLGDPELVELTRGAASAIASLRGLGFKIVVVTNQGGVARGRYTEDDVHAVHQRISELVRKSANGASIDAFYYCPYSPNGNLKQYKKDHENRKPNPGMLLQAAEELKLDLTASWMIGDQLTDVQAGHRAGARTILLREDAASLRALEPAQLAGVVSEVPDADRPVSPDFFASGLIEACRIIAQQRKPETNEPVRARAGVRKWDKSKIAELQKQRPAAEEREDPVEKPSKPHRAFRPWGAPVEDDVERPIVEKPYRKKLFKEEDAEDADKVDPANRADHADHAETPPAAGPSESADAPAPGNADAAPYLAGPGAPALPGSAGGDDRPASRPATQRVEPAEHPPNEPAPTERQSAERQPAEAASAVAASASPRDIPENIRQAIQAKKQRDVEAEGAGPPAPPGPEKTLRLILQELRMQRNATAEFSYLKIVAIVLQIIALICLLGGLWMSGSDDTVFLRWMGGAVMAQLAMIATLQFDK